MIKKRIGHSLKACGSAGIPQKFAIHGQIFHLQRIFKHDFFAATGLYASTSDRCRHEDLLPDRVVLKIARSADFLGLPMGWLGRCLCDHEWRILNALQGIPGTPRIVERWQRNGLIYTYIEGDSLDQKPALPDDFFDQMNDLLRSIHAQHILYLDMNKKGNILLGKDGKPYLIDYQISCEIPCDVPLLGPFLRGLKNILQKEDFYHIEKHKRRFRRDLMTPEQMRSSKRVSPWIALHRMIARPLTKARRTLLYRLAKAGYLADNDTQMATPENDPNRWVPKQKK